MFNAILYKIAVLYLLIKKEIPVRELRVEALDCKDDIKEMHFENFIEDLN